MSDSATLGQRRVLEIDLDVRPDLEPERRCTFAGAAGEKRLEGEDVPAQRPAARDAFQLAQLLQWVDADIRIGADAQAELAFANALDGQEAVAEVRLRRRAGTNPCSRFGQQVELPVVRVRRVDDRRARAEAAGLGEELDRPHAVLLDALVDLARLLVGVDVEGQIVLLGVAADLLEPVGRTGADGVGGKPDPDSSLSETLDLVEVFGGRRLPEALQAAARVGGVEEDEGDARCLRGLRGRERLLEAEVMELADRRVPGGEHLAVDELVVGAHPLRRLLVGEGEHGVAPGPEVAACGAPPKRPLKGVAVCVDEARDRETPRHEAKLSAAQRISVRWYPPTSSPI